MRRDKNAVPQISTRRSPVSIRLDTVTEEGTFEGYGSVFNALDSYGDTVLAGAYASACKRHADGLSRVKLLWQHDPEQPVGVWDEIVEDDYGLKCRGRLLLDVPKAREALALMRAGAIDGLSIGFETVSSHFARPGEVELRDGYAVPAGGQIRVVTEIDLWEVSIVTFQSLAPAVVTSVRKVPQAPQKAPPILPDDVLAALARRQAAIGRYLGR